MTRLMFRRDPGRPGNRGQREDSQPGPIWGAFAVLREQVERMVALNLFWSLQLLPGVAGLAFRGWPLPLRSALVIVSLIVIVPTALAVYRLLALACEGEEVSVGAAREAWTALARPSFRALAPLYVGTALLGGATYLVTGQAGWGGLEVLLRLALLFVLVMAMYWGPLLAEDPGRSAVALLRESAQLLRHYPGRTLWAAVASLAAVIIAAVSVGGLFLIAFVLLALFQTQLLRTIRHDRRYTPKGEV